MATDIEWMIIFDLLLISIFEIVPVSSALSRSAGKHNWTNSFQKCNLAKENQLDEINVNGRVWVGGVFNTTLWMTHKGCYRASTLNEVDWTHSETNSPAQCSLNCRRRQYFALKNTVCLCLSYISTINKSEASYCNNSCPDLTMNMTCGNVAHGYLDVYKHNLDLEVLGEEDSRKACTILKKNPENRVFFHATSCSDKYRLFCHLPGTDYINDIAMTYQDAIKIDNECKLLRDWDREYYGLVPYDQFVWTAVHRYIVLIWPLRNHMNTDEIEKENPNATCLAYERKTNKRIQLPCRTPLHYMCITETTDHTRNTTSGINDITTFHNVSRTTMTSFGNNTEEFKQGHILQYFIHTSVVSGLVIIAICAVWMCKKGKETIKRESNISFQGNNVTFNATAADGHISALYTEVNYNGMIDYDIKNSQKKGIIVGEEPTCSYTQRSQSYGNLFPQHEYERPYHTLKDNRSSSKHEYCWTAM
ncbi:uncharacterized protein LOC127707603 isoform X2 [Mytilus californianus]|uniref:uncharacterized protein LOC127707603 isoform X2 n=1 Tax=Mytilus californianus TaxID=6549 RepID=UPI0022470DDB|nr:uncharacterized protein LOC127707603 isoform X2 [Mytilus californianus]